MSRVIFFSNSNSVMASSALGVKVFLSTIQLISIGFVLQTIKKVYVPEVVLGDGVCHEGRLHLSGDC